MSYTLSYPDNIALNVSPTAIALVVQGQTVESFDPSGTVCTTFTTSSGISYTLVGLQLFNNAFAPPGTTSSTPCSMQSPPPGSLIQWWRPIVPTSTTCSFTIAPALTAKPNLLSYAIAGFAALLVVAFLFLVLVRSDNKIINFLQHGIGVISTNPLRASVVKKGVKKSRGGFVRLVVIAFIITVAVVAVYIRQRYLSTFQVLGNFDAWGPSLGSAYPLVAPFLGYLNQGTPRAITTWMAQAPFPSALDATTIQILMEEDNFSAVNAFQCMSCSNVGPACAQDETQCPTQASDCDACAQKTGNLPKTATSTLQQVVDGIFQYGVPVVMVGATVLGGE